MDIDAKCANPECIAFGKEKSVTLGQMLGYNVGNYRVRCPACGTVMVTTESTNTSEQRRGKMLRRKTPSKRSPKRK